MQKHVGTCDEDENCDCVVRNRTGVRVRSARISNISLKYMNNTHITVHLSITNIACIVHEYR